MTPSMKQFLRIGLFVALIALPSFVLAEQPADLGFTPLTSIPFIEEAGNADTLPDFLNGLYKLCIGLAAALAVLQIMRAGIMYMGGDSVTEKKEARNLIGLSIGGLILVLSPVIVFSIINPDILSLKVDGIEKLGTFTKNSQKVFWTDTDAPRADAKARCEADGGTPVYTCQAPGSGAARTVPYGEACAAGEDGITVCNAPSGLPDSEAACKESYTNITVKSQGQTCDIREGLSTIPHGCCAGSAAGTVCCGKLSATGQ